MFRATLHINAHANINTHILLILGEYKESMGFRDNRYEVLFESNGTVLKKYDQTNCEFRIMDESKNIGDDYFIFQVNLRENNVLIFAPEKKESKELMFGYFINETMLKNKPFRIAISLNCRSRRLYSCGLGIVPFEKYFDYQASMPIDDE